MPLVWEPKDQKHVVQVGLLEPGEDCPKCGSYEAEYRVAASDKKGYEEVGLKCHDCGQISVGLHREFDVIDNDFEPEPVPSAPRRRIDN